MKELKVHIQHIILCKFKHYKNSIKTAKKIFNVYGQRVITGRQVQNWFSKFHPGDTWVKDEPRPGRSSDFDQDSFSE